MGVCSQVGWIEVARQMEIEVKLAFSGWKQMPGQARPGRERKNRNKIKLFGNKRPFLPKYSAPDSTSSPRLVAYAMYCSFDDVYDMYSILPLTFTLFYSTFLVELHLYRRVVQCESVVSLF